MSATSALTAVMAKFGGLSLVAKAGVGIAVAVGVAAGAPAVAVAVNGAGDDPVIVSPTAEPRTDPTVEPAAEPSPTVEPTVEPTAEPTADPTSTPTPEPSDDPEDPADGGSQDGQGDNFGAWVSTQAHEGGVDGQEISQAAHARNEQRAAAKASSAPKGSSKKAHATGSDD